MTLYTEEKIVNLIETENIEILYEAIQSGLDLNQPFWGMNALFWAVKNNSYKVANFLLDNQFDINLKGIYKGDVCNALGVAIFEKNNYFFHFLIDHNIEANWLYQSKTMLMHAIELDDVQLVEKILTIKNIDINEKDNIYSDTALIVAARNNQEKILETLLKHPLIKTTSSNVLQYSALRYYLEQENANYELIKLFILSGSTFNLNDFSKRTPEELIELNELSYFFKEYGKEAKNIYLEKQKLEQSIEVKNSSKRDKKI